MKKIIFLIALTTTFAITNAQLQIGAGTNLRSNNSTYIVLNNIGLKYDATTTLLDNTFKFSGNADAAISGINTPIFTQLQVAKTSPGKLILQRDINIFQSVVFQSGLFDIGNNNVNLGNGASLTGENETTRFVGNNGEIIIILTITSAPLGVNPGNLGARITTSNNMGTVIIRRGHKSQTSNGVGSSILRYYNIEPTNNTGLNATFRFQFLEAELNGLLESSLSMWKSSNNSNWQNVGFTSRNTIANWVELTGINDFSRWTLSSPGNALPLTWNSFAAVCNNNNVTVSWKTLQESNTLSFIIEKSLNGLSWNPIGILSAAGNSTTAINYQYTDQSNYSGVTYYRIRQKDIDDRFSYSPVLRTECNKQDIIKLFPTVTNDIINISAPYSSTIQKMDIRINDAVGKTIFQIQLPYASQQLSLSHLAAGMYIVTMRYGDKSISEKIIKQ